MLTSNLSLSDYIRELEANGRFTVLCKCGTTIYNHEKKDEIKFGMLPEDDWLDTSPSMEYYCSCACSTSDPELKHLANHTHYNIGLLSFTSDSANKWLPDLKKIILTNSYVMFEENVRIFILCKSK